MSKPRTEDAVHVVPDFGREHDISPTCWCQPKREKLPGAKRPLWIHNLAN